MTTLIAFISGGVIGAFFGAKLGWKHAFRELGGAELRNRMATARKNRPWHTE